jgi:RNA polymerase sigma-70 factor (ECF subfamily)
MFELWTDHSERAKELAALTSRPDASLITAVSGEEPNEKALQALVDRYWKTLYSRCELLTLDRDKAKELAQETWVRVLRARTTLRPDGNFGGYITTIATNIWRDQLRSERCAGALARARLLPLDARSSGDDDSSIMLGETLPDVRTASAEAEILLKIDLDWALSRLPSTLREVVIARYVDGETAAEIGRRVGRTPQTITTWLRQAITELREQLVSTPTSKALATCGDDARDPANSGDDGHGRRPSTIWRATT